MTRLSDITDARSCDLMRRLLRDHVWPYRGLLALSGVFMTIVAAMTAATAWLLDPVINDIFVNKNDSLLWLIGGAVFGAFLIKSVAAFAQESLIGLVGQRIIADTQNLLYRHLLHQDISALSDRHSATLLSHFTFDINAMRLAVSQALVAIGRDSLSILFLVGVMFYQDWLLACIAFIVGPLAVAPVNYIGKKLRRNSSETQARMGEFSSFLSQSFQGMRVIRAYGMETAEKHRAAVLIGLIRDLSIKAAVARAAVQPIIDTLGGVAVAAVIIYGGARVMAGATTPGEFVSFIAAVLMAYQPLRALGKVGATLQEGLAAAERIFRLLDTKARIVDPQNPAALPKQAGAVVFDRVRFAYSGEVSALNEVSFEAPAGGVTALVGASGAGKSTVLNLIPRFYDPDAGQIRVNGVPIAETRLAALRATMALVSQEVTLFDDTVFNNIRYGNPNAGLKQVRAAASAAAAEAFIQNLPDGYDTVVGEHGLRLSGGQRQRLAIARAILKDAPILLLDEATSALDTESERQIQTALDRLMAGRTTLVIAHRLSTIQHADVIHVFDQGRVAESGTHKALLAKDGAYARLHRLQFAKERDD